MGSPALARADKLARRHSGVLTTSLLLSEGLDPRLAERQVRAGRWQRPARGVYLPHDRAPTGLELGHAAKALAGGRVVLSGLVVLRELGLRWVPSTPGILALVDADLRRPSSGRVTLRRTKELEALETWSRGGLELAPVERAVVDAARELSWLRDVRGVVLGAVADGWATADDLDQVLGTTQRNGSAQVRRAVGDAARGCASPPEAEVVDELVGCGRPFYVNPDLLLDGVLLGSPDVWLAALGLGGEVESKERHEDDDGQVESTYDRHERLTTPGIELVHLSVRRIRRDVREAAGHLLGRAAERERLGLGDPPGLTVVPRGPLLR
jgi:hypothetical protein